MEPEDLLLKTVEVLKEQNLPYMVCGGIAANFYGMPRPTYDVDIMVTLEEKDIHDFVSGLKRIGLDIDAEDFSQMLRVSNRVMLRGHTVPFRADFWWPKTEHERVAFQRRKRGKAYGRYIWFISPEDLIVQKLLSRRPRDIEDITGVINRRGSKLNWDYLWNWSKILGRSAILRRITEPTKK